MTTVATTATRITAAKFVLVAVLDQARSVVPTRDAMPLLKNFQVTLRKDPDRLIVVATDLELSVVSSTIMIDFTEPGTWLVPASVFDALTDLGDGEVVMTFAGDGKLVLEGPGAAPGKSFRSVIPLVDGADYPDLPEVDNLSYIKVPTEIFERALNAVKGAASREVTRANLMMVDVSHGQMTTCDGARLQQYPIGDIDLDIQIPIGAVDGLGRLLSKTDLPTLEVAQTVDHLVFKLGNDHYLSNKLMASFPEMETALLTPARVNNEFTLVVIKDQLLNAIRQVRHTADKDTSAMQLTTVGHTLTVRAQEKGGSKSETSLDVSSWDGPDLTLTVNFNYLGQMLRMYAGDTATFKLGPSPKSSVLLTDPDSSAVGLIQQMLAQWKS